jgi:hypothetical protein
MCKWKPHYDGSSAGDFALDFDGPSALIDNGFADCEPEAGSPGLSAA